MAGQAILFAADPVAAATYLPTLASGARRATLAIREPGGEPDDRPGTRAEPTATGWSLTGVKTWVLDGQSADLLVVSALTAAGPSLFIVEAGAPGLEVEALTVVDPTRRVARTAFTGTPAVLLGADGGADEPLRRTLDVAITMLAAEQVGVAQAALEAATEYARQREQFGRPIGSFQAIKHKLATVLLELEAAISASMYALWAADQQPGELPEVAAIAGLTCSEAALLAASENIQVHGGMGATWEHSAHLYLKRATTSRLLLASPQQHLERLGALTNLVP
jgi:alkylation response protein AidB-like acyl-CoA dehydrogenase